MRTDVDIFMKFGTHVLSYIIYYLKKYLSKFYFENFQHGGHLKCLIVNNFLIFHFIKISILDIMLSFLLWTERHLIFQYPIKNNEGMTKFVLGPLLAYVDWILRPTLFPPIFLQILS